MAAEMTAHGLDGMAFLTTEDPVLFQVMRVVFVRARKETRRLDQERASLIASAVGKLFK